MINDYDYSLNQVYITGKYTDLYIVKIGLSAYRFFTTLSRYEWYPRDIIYSQPMCQ